ncbi:MAG: SBBP repeat-containing protein [Candidatus Odinarchaeota archaeon]
MKYRRKIIVSCILATLMLTIAMMSSTHTPVTSVQGQTTQTELEDYTYCTLVGGFDEDIIRNVDVDSEGNIIVTGSTYSHGFPVLNAYQDTYGGGAMPEDYHVFGGDGIVAKFSADGQLLWSTFLGGTNMDCIHSTSLDTSDNIIVIGTTNSTDFPVTADAYQSAYAGGSYDLFITRFAANGSMVYSSYFGGTGHDESRDFVLDSSGNLVIVGGTSSLDFPLTADAADKTCEGAGEGFLTIIAADFSNLLYSTFFGGSDYEGGDEIAIDGQGNIIITGPVTSYDFPVTDDAYQDAINGSERDSFIAKFNASGHLIYASYFGGSDMDDCFGMTLDSAGNIIMTGRTWSTDFPTKNAYQDSYAGLNMEGVDSFIAKLSADGQDLIFSTYLGDTGWDTAFNPVVDLDDNILVTLLAGPGTFPVIDAFQPTRGGVYDILVIMLSSSGNILFSSYLGGVSNEHPYDQFITNGTIYIVGTTQSSNFPVTSNAYQQMYKGNSDGFIFRFEIDAYLLALESSKTTTTTTATAITTSTAATPGFELSLVLAGLVSLLVMSRRRGRKQS